MALRLLKYKLIIKHYVHCGFCIVYFLNEKILSVQLPSGGVLRNIFTQKGVLVLKMVGSIMPSCTAYRKCFARCLAQRSLRREQTRQAGYGELWPLSWLYK